VYGYGYNSVARLIEKIHHKKNPPGPIENSPLTPVTLENVDAFAKNWEKWLTK
jgi:ribose transport system substrate-binding protein